MREGRKERNHAGLGACNGGALRCGHYWIISLLSFSLRKSCVCVCVSFVVVSYVVRVGVFISFGQPL